MKIKVMTQEQKAKAYNEVREKIALRFGSNVAEEIFSEFEMSEDEMIRKKLITFFQRFPYTNLYDVSLNAKDVLAWLEKQNEQKPVNDTDEDFSVLDMVEPKFKVGDWIVQENIGVYKVIEVCKYWYEVVDNKEKHYSIGFDKEYMCHLWTIQDAKDGDVLASELCDSIILFRGIKDDNIDFYCDYDFSKIDIPGDRFAVNNGQHYGNVEDSKDFHPATKEQRDTLFTKMREAGYIFNFEKKELKKIEFNTDNLIEESHQQQADDLIDMVTEKPTWSKEDEDYYDAILAKLEVTQDDAALTDNQMEFLKSLKDRVIPQSKQEWSEEDESYLNTTIAYLKDAKEFKKTAENCIDWLKSLKERIENK